jgi:hypothetical protein
MMGRKTKYIHSYNELLISHMKLGHSYTSFASKIQVHIDTLYEWEKKYPEYSEAKKLGLTLSQSFWEDIGREMAINGNFNAWKFNMKNRFGWRDNPAEELNQSKEPPKLIIQLDSDDMLL